VTFRSPPEFPDPGRQSFRTPQAAFWAREDRYTASLTLEVRGRALRLHPLPHPSPLNATWYRRFPALLDDRLAALGWPDPADRALIAG
jgi:hypothetical protein